MWERLYMPKYHIQGLSFGILANLIIRQVPHSYCLCHFSQNMLCFHMRPLSLRKHFAIYRVQHYLPMDKGGHP